MLRRTALSGTEMRSRAARPALVSKTRLIAPVSHNRLVFRDGIWTRTRATPILVSNTLVCGAQRCPLSVTDLRSGLPHGRVPRGITSANAPRADRRSSDAQGAR